MPDVEPAARDYPAFTPRTVVDPALGVLARLMDLQGITAGISIVLVIPGGVLTGRLVNGASWYQEWLSGISKAGDAGVGFANTLRGIFTADGRAADDTGFIDHTGQYLHILDGVFRSANDTLGAMPWRLRLDSVAAWSLGTPPEENA